MKCKYKQECIPVGCIPPAAVAIRGPASVHAGIHPLWVWACRPPGCGPRDPHPPRSGDPQRPDPSTSPLGVGLETPLLETCCKACWDTTCNACWDTTPTPVNRLTDMYKNKTLQGMQKKTRKQYRDTSTRNQKQKKE